LIRRALTVRRVLVAVVLALVTAGAGAGGYAVARSTGPSDEEITRAHEAAYREAFDLGERAGYISSRRDGFRDGEQEGLKAGRIAGRLIARDAIASATTIQRAKPTRAFVPPETIWAVGDGDATGGGRAVAQMIASNSVDHFLYLGDVYPSGTRADFLRNWDPTYGVLANIGQPTPGNHDWPNHSSGYDWYWQRAKGQPQPHNYTFTAGGWQLISMNSEQDIGGQASWAEQQVSSSPQFGTCRLAYWHRPLMSAGTVHGDDGEVAPLWSAVAGKAAIVLNGHEHDMQRFKPRDGTTEFVVGSGGHEHYSLRSDSRLAFGNDTDYGALQLVLKPGSARYSFVSASGKVLDSGNVPCKRGKP
jgi:hypothetical protein